MATVFIPEALRSFSNGRDRVSVSGATLRQVFSALDAACPGIRERLVADEDIHPGLAIFIDDEMTSGGLVEPVGEESEIRILPAMAGGT